MDFMGHESNQGSRHESRVPEAEQSLSAATSFAMETPVAQAVLAKSVTVTGEVYCNEPLTIEGEVDGSIDVTGHLLTIAPPGNVRASVRASEIDVLGSLHGKVEGADKIYIRNGARVVGDIHARSLVIEDGGFVRGKVDLSRQGIFPFDS
jgi:cytoskeletal protein CcmA (bactofilin family)